MRLCSLCCSGVLEMLQLDQSTGNILHQKSYKENRGGSLQSVVLRQDLVFGLTCDGRQLCTATIQGVQEAVAPLFCMATHSTVNFCMGMDCLLLLCGNPYTVSDCIGVTCMLLLCAYK